MFLTVEIFMPLWKSRTISGAFRTTLQESWLAGAGFSGKGSMKKTSLCIRWTQPYTDVPIFYGQAIPSILLLRQGTLYFMAIRPLTAHLVERAHQPAWHNGLRKAG